MQEYPDIHLEGLTMAGKSGKALKGDRQRHLRNVKASDARKQDKGLLRIAIWVPCDEADQFKKAAKLAVDRHLMGWARVCKVEIPKPWRDPKPKDDRRQLELRM
ncbi:hypothetical protein [Roseinatronobacter bogoriensis]|uniref:hypothetical protein n=1 Tax=Roseinatronobacter bogoriensis TaxID=119542 RepID=UPI0014562BC0|nr:hypothetical protein [Rhodobaca barguzinensis]